MDDIDGADGLGDVRQLHAVLQGLARVRGGRHAGGVGEQVPQVDLVLAHHAEGIGTEELRDNLDHTGGQGELALTECTVGQGIGECLGQGEDAVDVILLGGALGGALGETVGSLECDLTVLGDDDVDAVVIAALDICLDGLFDALELCWVQSHGGVCFLQVENVVW